jgi:hypothetical protein
MATCKKIETTPVPPPVEYQLTLSQDEADYLLKLSYCQEHSAGDGGKIAQGIYLALTNAGAQYYIGREIHPVRSA